MKLGLVIKLNKRNTITSKKIEDDVISTTCDVIVLFPIYDQLAAIKFTFSLIVTFYLTKSENRTKKYLIQL